MRAAGRRRKRKEEKALERSGFVQRREEDEARKHRTEVEGRNEGRTGSQHDHAASFFSLPFDSLSSAFPYDFWMDKRGLFVQAERAAEVCVDSSCLSSLPPRFFELIQIRSEKRKEKKGRVTSGKVREGEGERRRGKGGEPSTKKVHESN